LRYQTIQSLPNEPDPQFIALKEENRRLKELISSLRQELIIRSAQIALLNWFQAMVKSFFPQFGLKRFDAWQKKYIIDMSDKFSDAGGLIKNFCKAIGKSTCTIAEWKDRYLKFGMAGLVDKKTRPRNFAGKMPLWLKEQLIILFTKHPQWTTYQYHKYMRDNPAISRYVSLSAIEKVKSVHKYKFGTVNDQPLSS
jgi:hypothetical protein